MTTKPEVLAPVGGRPQLAAAINAGADAVYFGLSQFNARARAANFDVEELPEIMAELHEHGVQGFVTFNTLVFDEELAAAERMLVAMDDAGVDAAIVQDLGVAASIRQVAPGLPIHGSTQMTVTSAESAELVAQLGVERVVLGRELSIREIGAVARGTDLELEVFVHGALCVSYSGQCFSSEAWGGRSANRGQCAQACRLPYNLVVDGTAREDAEHRYVLSPQDLFGVDFVPALIEAGVSSLKIEGRLKGPEYVALTTATYRRAVDAACAGTPWSPNEDELRDLQQVFSRGLTPGFLEGPKHQRLVRGRFPKHRGLLAGRVAGVSHRKVFVDLQEPLKPGDGVVFDAGRPQDGEVGGTVHTVLVEGKPVASAVGEATIKLAGKVRVERLQPGDRIWRTRDPALLARLEPQWRGGVERRSPVQALVEGAAGEPLALTLTDSAGRRAQASTGRSLEASRARALDGETLRASLGRLGGTPLELDGLEVRLDGELFLPVSELNRVRRAAVDGLLGQRREQRVRDRSLPPLRLQRRAPAREATPDRPALSLLCRTREQVEAAIAVPGLGEIAVDFLEVKGLGEAVQAIQAAGIRAVAVSPRVLKPQEENLRAFLLKLGADALLVRSLGLLHSLLDTPGVPPLLGDFSLNATNRRTVDLLLGSGLSRLAAGHDLNAAQLAALPEPATAERLEVIAHHHLPIFHTEHCVFARFLSDGDSKKDCGAPCEHHELHLRGGDGEAHLVQADMGCRNTVFNGRAQSAVRQLGRLVSAGYRRFRIELVDHRPDEVAPLVAQYRGVLDGAVDPQAAWRWLQERSRFGVTLGSLQVVQALRPSEMKQPGWLDRG